jgi:hypothetical protein
MKKIVLLAPVKYDEYGVPRCSFCGSSLSLSLEHYKEKHAQKNFGHYTGKFVHPNKITHLNWMTMKYESEYKKCPQWREYERELESRGLQN